MLWKEAVSCYTMSLVPRTGVTALRGTARKVRPEDYVLSVLSPEDRLDAAFKVAGEAFKKSKLTLQDVENAVRLVRRKAYEKQK